MAEILEKMSETLHDGTFRRLRPGGGLPGIDPSGDVRKDRGDIVGSARRMRITKQVEGR